MTTANGRRAVLALLPACVFLSSWAQAGATEPDPVYAAMEAHRQAYEAMSDAWSATESVASLYARRETDPDAEAQLRRISDAESAEEDAFAALLAVRPATKAGAIAAVRHVADIGFCPDNMRAWLAMLLDSPLVETRA